MDQNLWYKDTVFYELSVRAFRDSNADGQGDLRGITSKLDYLQFLGIGCIWLMPFYPSPLKDDGYDVSDYRAVAEAAGTLADFKLLIEAAHQRHIRVITDLVMNHTSDQHAWFRSARADRKSPYRNSYVWSDTEKKYGEARIIFVDSQPSYWAWEEACGRYFWQRFYFIPPALNFYNFMVRVGSITIAGMMIELTMVGFRLGASP